MRVIGTALLVLSLFGCMPYYGPMNAAGVGYSDVELSPRIHRVDFYYNAAPLVAYVGPSFEELVLLRSADLALERHHRYFILDTTALPGSGT